MKHVIVLPYIDHKEVARLKRTGAFLAGYSKNRAAHEFLLVNKKTVAQSDELLKQYSKVSHAKLHELKTTVTGYPEGPDSFFWESMEYIAQTEQDDGGFVLWMESDMIPVAPDWIDRLEREWVEKPGLLEMGLFFPKRFIVRLLAPIPDHINGGACYSKRLAVEVPMDRRGRCFDVALFQYVKETGRCHKSELFAFASMKSISNEATRQRAIVHGYRQEKDLFIDRSIQILTGGKAAPLAEPVPCCDLGRGFLSCPIHEENTAWNRLKANAVWYLFKLVIFFLEKRFDAPKP